MGMDLDRADSVPSTPESPAAEAAQATERLQGQAQAQRVGPEQAINSVPTTPAVQELLGNVTIGHAVGESQAAQPNVIREAHAESIQLRELLQGGKTIDKVRPMTRTEQFIASSLSGAIQSGDTKQVAQLLGVLSENPGMVSTVLNAVRNTVGDKPRQVNWESGTNDAGQPFVRLQIREHNAMGGGTSIRIGSDGQTSATYTKYKGGTELSLDPNQALTEMMAPRRNQNHHNHERQERINPESPNRPGRTPVPSDNSGSNSSRPADAAATAAAVRAAAQAAAQAAEQAAESTRRAAPRPSN